MEQEMNVDPQRIRQLREARAWSQEHLASVSGLSPRTIQRLETSGTASAESRLALAAAFDLSPADLLAPPPATAPSPALPPLAQRKSLAREAFLYLGLCGGMLAFDLLRHQSITWSKWPLLGWGSALLLRHLLRRKAPPQIANH